MSFGLSLLVQIFYEGGQCAVKLMQGPTVKQS